MTRRIFFAVACMAFFALAGCADDGDGGGGVQGGSGDGGGHPPPPRSSCSVSISSSTFGYEVGDAGRMLTLAPGTPAEQVLERLGAVSGSIDGAWLLGEQTQNGLTSHIELLFAQGNPGTVAVTNRCSGLGASLVARVTSLATITDTQVTVLQALSDVEYSQ